MSFFQYKSYKIMFNFFYTFKIPILFSCLFIIFNLTACTSVNSKNFIQNIKKESNKNHNQYKIGKGDILEIITWKEPDFSKEIPVRIDGKISFPLLNDIQAAGRTCNQIRDELAEKLKEFITHPVVSISVKDYGSQKFYIIGEVLNPGEYPLIKTLTVLQTFAIAGGLTEWASKDEIVLIRNEQGKDIIIKINYKKIVKGEALSQNVQIKADDIIVVP